MVTLHFLDTGCPNEEDCSRFLREAAICAGIDHPNVVRFLSQGVAGDMLWFATELAEGETLKQLVEKRGPLSVEDALTIMGQALNMVAHSP